jgi:hypothetical protein
METRSNAQRFFGRWVFATFGGWLLGVVVIVLLSGIGELVHLGGDQWAVGVGMGWSIGCAQWWVARKWFGTSSEWMWASVVGMGTPFVLSDLVGAWGHGGHAGMLSLVGLVNVALGGLLVGLWQRRTLRSHSTRANWWVPACIAGWMLTTTLPSALISFRTGPHWSNLVGIALGGVVLGVVTGSALVWVLLRSSAVAGQPEAAADAGQERRCG